MRLTTLLVSLSLAVLAGCAEGAPPEADVGGEAVASRAAIAPPAPGKTRPPGAEKTGAPEAPAVAAPLLAYSYSYRLETPVGQVRPLLKAHQAACEAAGPALCQVVQATSRGDGEGRASGSLAIKAEPGWLRRFRDRVEGDAKGAGGKVLSSATETEDLTRSIVDTEAGLRAATALQTRLEVLLVQRPGDLSDALEIERELARVRGEIDATRSQLAVMRGRVAMSSLTIDYSSPAQFGTSSHSPVASALGAVGNNVELVIALLITLASFLVPLAIVIGPLVWWILRRGRIARQARRAEAARVLGDAAPPT